MNVLSTRINEPFTKIARRVSEFAEEAILLQTDGFIKVDEAPDFNLYKINPNISTSEVPQWNMVIDIEIDREKYYLIDARPFESATRRHQPVYYNLLVERARALRAWYEDPIRFTGIAPQLTSAYIDWCSGILRSNAGLDPLQMAKFEMMFGLYIFAAIQIQADPHMDIETLFQTYRQLLSGKLGFPRPVVDDVFDGDNGFIVINGLTEAFTNGLNKASLDTILMTARQIVETRAITLDAGALMHLAEKSWMGDNAVALSMTAIEHPAIFASLVAVASVNPIFRRSRIGQAVDGLQRRRLDKLAVHKALVR